MGLCYRRLPKHTQTPPGVTGFESSVPRDGERKRTPVLDIFAPQQDAAWQNNRNTGRDGRQFFLGRGPIAAAAAASLESQMIPRDEILAVRSRSRSRPGAFWEFLFRTGGPRQDSSDASPPSAKKTVGLMIFQSLQLKDQDPEIKRENGPLAAIACIWERGPRRLSEMRFLRGLLLIPS
ncbi:UNVERIFIED_CONTAM: hypothetical protein K2H54_055458 [Gekko kuhli]